jgi:hypothetical protein
MEQIKLIADNPLDQVTGNIRKDLEILRKHYPRAKAFIESPEGQSEQAQIRQSVENLVRQYSIGDAGDVAIGLLAAARQALTKLDWANNVVAKYESLLLRLHDLENRPEDSGPPQDDEVA